MIISGWGQYPKKDSQVLQFRQISELPRLVSPLPTPATKSTCIARGQGRSYGDSSLADICIDTSHHDYFIEFNETTGLLTCTGGMTLEDIIDTFLPKGWFLPVTPGTQYVSIGGAIASDVHGKNHHRHGCFSNFVESIELYTGANTFLLCSKNNNPDLFHATCGGMGLTGIIVKASIKLIPVNSAYIDEKTIKTKNLDETLEQFERSKDSTYSVAWIDCLARDKNLGRAIISLGEHSKQGGVNHPKRQPFQVPFNLPNQFLNPYSIKCFNELYYRKAQSSNVGRTVPLKSFFYPLDSIGHWNRIYGNQGFMQFQCAIPRDRGYRGIRMILKEISNSQTGSFLAVLKELGERNNNYLSFPIEGYTLALDFKVTRENYALQVKLNRLICEIGGKIYLAKDSTMNENDFKHMYPEWIKLTLARQKYNHGTKFNSLQSSRLGLYL